MTSDGNGSRFFPCFLLAAAAAAVAATANRLHYCLVTRHCSLALCHYMYLINVVKGTELNGTEPQPATRLDAVLNWSEFLTFNSTSSDIGLTMRRRN